MASESDKNRDRVAVVLIAHGSRNELANDDAFYFAQQLRQSEVAIQIEAAFLELAQPDIPTAVAAVVRSGAQIVVLLPYFLSPGVHVQRDLNEMCRQFASQHTNVRFILAQPLGRHSELTKVLLDRLREALVTSSPT
jgi:sirohydrochlorin ferrochelatase